MRGAVQDLISPSTKGPPGRRCWCSTAGALCAAAAIASSPRSTRARARWSTTPRRSGPRSSARSGRAQRRRRRPAHRRHRHHQPARDHAAVGPRRRPAGRQRHRLAGPAHRAAVRRSSRPPATSLRCASGPAWCWIPTFRRPRSAWLLDNVAGLRARAEAGRDRLRHGRQLPDLAADRRQDARHRRHQRVAHAAVRPPHAAIRSRAVRAVRRAARRCCPRSARRPGARRDTKACPDCPTASRSPASRAISRRPCSGRTAPSPGDAKCTFGTGAFLLMNVGAEPKLSTRGLLTTRGLDAGHRSVARDGVRARGQRVHRGRAGAVAARRARAHHAAPAEIEALARSVPDSGGVTIVPALTGLGARTGAPRRAGSSPA